MRVFELMEELAKLPAGAHVIFEAVTDKSQTENVDTCIDDDDQYCVFYRELEVYYNDVTERVKLTAAR